MKPKTYTKHLARNTILYILSEAYEGDDVPESVKPHLLVEIGRLEKQWGLTAPVKLDESED